MVQCGWGHIHPIHRLHPAQELRDLLHAQDHELAKAAATEDSVRQLMSDVADMGRQLQEAKGREKDLVQVRLHARGG